MIELIGRPLYQWDTGRKVSGFTGNAAQFANKGDSQAMTIKVKDGSCRIPDRYLMSGSPVLVYDVQLSDDGEVATTNSVTVFAVKAKPKPKDYVPTAAEESLGIVKKLTDEAKAAAISAGDLAQDASDSAKAADSYASNAKASADRAEQYAKEAEEASKKGSSLVIRTEGDTFEANFNAREIFEEVSTGRDAVLQFVEDETVLKTITLSAATESMAFFAEFSDSVANVYTVDGDGDIDMKEFPISLFAVLDDKKCTEKNTWSAKNIVDKLCPPISETGLVVQFEAVEGYPLEVSAKESGDIDGVSVTVCAKNLYDAVSYPMTPKNMIRYASGNAASSTSYSATLDFIPCEHLRGRDISIRYAPIITSPSGSTAGIAFYDENKIYLSGYIYAQVTVPEAAVYMRFSINTEYEDEAQIELGNVVTDYEPYFKNTFTASNDASGAFIPVPGIVGRSGLTTIFAYDGAGKVTDVKVSGRADPNAQIRRLTDDVAELKAAFLSLGTNM